MKKIKTIEKERKEIKQRELELYSKFSDMTQDELFGYMEVEFSCTDDDMITSGGVEFIRENDDYVECEENKEILIRYAMYLHETAEEINFY